MKSKRNFLKQWFRALFIITILLLLTCSVGCGERRSSSKIVNAELSLPPPTIKKLSVYIENSGSMDGYVNGNTLFKDQIYNYLTDLQNNIVLPDSSFSLNYICADIVPWKPNIHSFITTLNPKEFLARRKGCTTTDIATILETILRNKNKEDISILISDFIFSAQSNTPNLNPQMIQIKNIFAKYLNKDPHQALIIYQLESEFKGVFYNINNAESYNGLRPYYMWIIGDQKRLTILRKKCPESKFLNNGIQNYFSIIKGNQIVDYSVVMGSGKFMLSKSNPKTAITGAKIDTKGRSNHFSIAIDVDFSHLILDEEYLLDKNNYTINDKDYMIKSIVKSPIENYSHRITLQTEIIKPSHLTVELQSSIPQWISTITNPKGNTIKNNEGKTFGFDKLVKGVYQAYMSENNVITSLSLSINESK